MNDVETKPAPLPASPSPPRESRKTRPGRVACPFCGKDYTRRGLATHVRFKHPGKDLAQARRAREAAANVEAEEEVIKNAKEIEEEKAEAGEAEQGGGDGTEGGEKGDEGETALVPADREFDSIPALEAALGETPYVSTRELATALFLALKLHKPLLIEGPPGTGKTAIAGVLAALLNRKLVRLQCYEGIDEAQVLYEWQYSKQILYMNLFKERWSRVPREELANGDFDELAYAATVKDQLFTEEFLLKRPLTDALMSERPVVLLVDEIDRTDPEVEAMLLETLSENQVTIPELGTIAAASAPLVILTSNATRRLSEALRRRCLYFYTEYPDFDTETEILRRKYPELQDVFRDKIVSVVHKVRGLKYLKKAPSVSETLDWARSLMYLNAGDVDRGLLKDTLGILLKHKEDFEQVTGNLAGLFPNLKTGASAGAGG